MSSPNPAQAPAPLAGYDERVQPDGPLSGEVKRGGAVASAQDSPYKREGMIYGDLPLDLGLIDLSPVEMMFWLYCPISTPTEVTRLPPNLEGYRPIIQAIFDRETRRYQESYVYLTAKTLWVSPGNPGNRPGWHSDGFGSDDVNYIWYDSSPTEFIEDPILCVPDYAEAMAYARCVPHRTMEVIVVSTTRTPIKVSANDQPHH